MRVQVDMNVGWLFLCEKKRLRIANRSIWLFTSGDDKIFSSSNENSWIQSKMVNISNYVFLTFLSIKVYKYCPIVMHYCQIVPPTLKEKNMKKKKYIYMYHNDTNLAFSTSKWT